ncbi:hypothetical protein E8E11_008748 [Didymella keratinophila]|nr:hypothetical protein E8E11_008748 [Didymella keratinophila]
MDSVPTTCQSNNTQQFAHQHPTMDDQTALGRRIDWFGNLEMVWVKEPDMEVIESIVRRQLDIPDGTSCTVRFLAEGASNKVYKLQIGSNDRYIMRIPLPVQPRLQTMSEVATIDYVRQHTDNPVPTVLKFQATSQDELGFEWILMTHTSGTQKSEQWRSIPWLKKELIMPGFESGFFLGRIVEQPLFWGNHLQFDVNREPFENSRDWLRAVLQIYILGADHPVTLVGDSEDDFDSDDELSPLCSPEAIKVRAQRLMDLLSTIFPTDTSETFVLHHHDLHESNIFVDDNHELSGVIDWECLPTVPLWAACEIPKFLQSKLNRYVCPGPDQYSKETLGDGTEGMGRLYYEHLAEYEKTQLRAVFLEEMQRVCPDWVDVYKNNKLKAAFGEAVALFGDKSNAKIIDEWLDVLEEDGDAPIPLDIEYMNESEHFRLSQVVSIPCFFHEHWRLDIPQGPYARVQDWLAARLQLAAAEIESGDDNETEEETDESGDDGIETDMHVLLTPESKHLRKEDAPPPFRKEFRDERDEMDYWRRIEEHEKTRLREFYLEEMQRVCPEWVQIHEAGVMKADFDYAVNIDSLGATVAFEYWLKQLEYGQEPLAFRQAMGQF